MISGINKKLQQLEAWTAGISLLALLSLSIFQIIIRNLFDFGYTEIEVINRHMLVICGLMGAVLATSHQQHIKTDALAVLLSDSTRQKIAPLLNLFASLICLLLTYYSVTFVQDEWQYLPANERWTLPFIFIYPLAFLLMAYHFTFNALSRTDSRDVE